MTLTEGTVIKFASTPRYKDFTRGGTGTIERVLAKQPFSTDAIYLIRLDNIDSDNNVVWATGSEVFTWNQLSLLS